MESPFLDKISPVLEATGALSREQKESVWDAFHSSTTPEEFANKIAGMNFPLAVKHMLYRTKVNVMPEPSHADKVVDVLKRMSVMDAKALDMAEAHPNVLKAITADKD